MMRIGDVAKEFERKCLLAQKAQFERLMRSFALLLAHGAVNRADWIENFDGTF